MSLVQIGVSVSSSYIYICECFVALKWANNCFLKKANSTKVTMKARTSLS